MVETWPFKDIDSKPARGRFYPISFAEAVQATNKYQLVGLGGKRVRVCLLNHKDDDTAALLFAEYRPEHALILYSWPENVTAPAASKAVSCSFPIFAPLRRIRVPDGRANFAGCYLLRLLRDGELGLTECKIYFQQGKYGGGQSFSSAYKRRLTRVEEKALPVPKGIEGDLGLVMSRGQSVV